MKTLIPLLISALTLLAAEPPIRVKPGLFQQSIDGTLGLDSISGETQVLFQASASTYKYSHHPNLAVFKGRLYLMWSSGREGENQNGQRIVYRSTADGKDWTPLTVLAEDPDGSGPLHGVAAGFLVRGEKLIAFYSGAQDEQPLHPASTLFARVSTDGVQWGEQIRVAQGFFNQPPSVLPSGRVILAGHSHAPQPKILYSDSPTALDGWKEASIPPIDEFPVRFVEPTCYRRADGALTMLFRANKDSLWLWASVSRDDGATWTKAVQTEMPDAVSKMAVGRLPDGRVYLLHNPNQRGRVPLALSFSKDGVTFDKAVAIRTEATEARFTGRAKGSGYQYPGAIVWNNALWVAYSINKEDVALTRISLSQLSAGAQAPELAYQAESSWPKLPHGWSLGETAGVAIGPQRDIWLFHRGPHPLMKFKDTGEFASSFGEGIFERPHAVRFDREGNLWAVDAGNHVVVRLDESGRVTMVLGRRGYADETVGHFNQPTDVAFASNGDIFVSDGYGNSRVVKFTREGKYVKSWGQKGTGAGEFNLPHTIFIDGRDRILVGDRENYRIQIFDTDGGFLEQWNDVGSPWGLSIAANGDIWMADGHNNRISQLTPNGQVVGVFGMPGKLPGQLDFAHHLAVDPNGTIYVGEILNWRAQKFVPASRAASQAKNTKH